MYAPPPGFLGAEKCINTIFVTGGAYMPIYARILTLSGLVILTLVSPWGYTFQVQPIVSGADGKPLNGA